MEGVIDFAASVNQRHKGTTAPPPHMSRTRSVSGQTKSEKARDWCPLPKLRRPMLPQLLDVDLKPTESGPNSVDRGTNLADNLVRVGHLG